MLGQLLPPKTALTLLKKRIESDINKKFDDFLLVYDKPNQSIEFHILDQIYPYEDRGAKLHSAIDSLLSMKLDKNHIIDIAVIDYKSKGKCCAKVAYRNAEGDKKQIELNI